MRPKDSIHSFTAPVRNKGKSQNVHRNTSICNHYFLIDMFWGLKKHNIKFYFLKIKPNIKHSLKNKGVIGQKTTILLQFVEGGNHFFFNL